MAEMTPLHSVLNAVPGVFRTFSTFEIQEWIAAIRSRAKDVKNAAHEGIM
jgi:hypothetical protein